MKPQVWVTLPQDADDEPARGLYEGDSYIVELATSEQVWAAYSARGGFELCDDEGNAIGDQRNPLTNVVRVMIRGYAAGFGPTCPKAGAAPVIHLVVASLSIVRAIDKAKSRARELLGESFGAVS